MRASVLPLLLCLAGPGCGGEIGLPRDGGEADADRDADADGDAESDGDPDDSGIVPDGDADGDADQSLPPCDPVAGSVTISTDPAAPYRGVPAVVRVRGDVGLTNVALVVEGSTATPSWIGVEGTGPYTWSWSLATPEAGDFCVVFSADPGGRVYQRARLHVAEEAPPVAPFKVVENHQWTCEEEYTFAINVDTHVLDETGAPIAGARVLVTHEPCETATDHPPPTEVVTDSDGFVRWENYNPRCFFHERVADAPSDTAIEIYTGIWEEQDGCNYCGTYAENVWGHWSYTVVFQRVPGATELCEVPTDHAGQSRCSPLLHWEEPAPTCDPP